MRERPAAKPRPCVLVLFGVGEYQVRLIRGATSVFERSAVPLLVLAEDTSRAGDSSLLISVLRDHSPAGVIISPTTTLAEQDRLVALLSSLRIPSALVGDQRADTASVTSDSEPAMRAIMAHLLDERGITRPALVRGVVHQSDSIRREQVFRDELTRRGLVVDEDLVIDGQYTYDHSYQAMAKLLHRRRDFDAAVALNDASAFGVMDALADAGVRVPDDVLVTGFDDDAAAAMRAPALTTVNQDVEGQAALAASTLIALIHRQPPPTDLTVANRLVVRPSTGSDPRRPNLRYEAAVEATRLLWSHVAVQETLLALNRAVFRCRTIDDMPWR